MTIFIQHTIILLNAEQSEEYRDLLFVFLH